MTIYLLNFLTIPIYTVCIARFGSKTHKRAMALLCFQMFLIMALRSTAIGSDIPNYAKYYAHWAGYSFREMVVSTRFLVNQRIAWGLESGYVWFNWLCAKLGCSFHTFLVIHAAVCMLGLYVFLTRHTDAPALVLAIFVSFGAWSSFFYILRQSLVFIVAIWAFRYAVERKPWKYLLVCCLAILFHRAALVLLPLYLVGRIRINRKIIVLFAVATVICPLILPTMNHLYRSFLALVGKGGMYHMNMQYALNNMTICMAILFAVMLVFSDHYSIFDDPKINLSGWFFMAAILLEELSPYVPEVSRIPLYCLFPFGAIALSSAIERLSTEKRVLVKANCYVVLFGFYIFVIRGSSIVPYIPVWN